MSSWTRNKILVKAGKDKSLNKLDTEKLYF